MDITERKITKIAREAEKLVVRTLREKDVGTAEIDLIHALRHRPGCTQAALAELLHADKAAIARRTKNLEAKGYLIRRDAPNDRRSQLLYPTEKAESLRSSKAEIEASFYEYLTAALSQEEAAAFAATLHKLYTVSKTESRAGFPHFRQAAEGRTDHEGE
ncbi:MAG: MarR family transcriptional regulator [Oscillospiraceae bacterium]|nr:MarR family transcriptional regulator [Oscillospiraceae bacterium]